jgi:hypothetical protein
MDPISSAAIVIMSVYFTYVAVLCGLAAATWLSDQIAAAFHALVGGIKRVFHA